MVGRMSKPTVSEKITVGISISLSGKFRLQGVQALRGVQLWVAYVNQKGGIYLKERAQSLPVEVIGTGTGVREQFSIGKFQRKVL